MVKHTQAIQQQISDELFECVWPYYYYYQFILSRQKKKNFYKNNYKIVAIPHVYHIKVNLIQGSIY